MADEYEAVMEDDSVYRLYFTAFRVDWPEIFNKLIHKKVLFCLFIYLFLYIYVYIYIYIYIYIYTH